MKNKIRRPSLKPLKQWCKARGWDWRKHLDYYPNARRIYLGY